MRVQSVNLNLIPTGVMPIVHLSQYDRDADGALLFNIFNGPTPFNLTGCTATINGTKPDGNVYTYPCTVHSNFLTSAVYDQMTTVQGTHEAEIRISDGDSVVGTLNFQMAIEKAGVSEVDVSHTDVPALLENIQASVDEAEYWAEQAAGAVAGVASFNGRHGSVLPVAGDYDASQISYGGSTVEEALDNMGGGHTILNASGQEMPQRKNLRFTGANVSDDAESDTTNVTMQGGAGGSTITVSTIETSLYGETVTITDGIATFTGVFDNTGVCVISGVTATGTLTVTSGAATRQLTVPYYGNYEVALSFWSAEITVTTDPGVNSAIVKKDGVNVGTISFSAGTGTYIAGSTGAYTFTATVGGVEFTSPTVNVTEQTSYSTSITIWSATLNISTGSSALYGKTITIKKGSTTVGTTAFSAQGSATYTVHETGTYTCECEGYSGSATVSAETTYNVPINAGLDLSAWITAGSTTDYPLNPSSYADFSALEADEAAVRQLMTVHDAVDFLAQATAGDSLVANVINSDVCAKWINLSDYALDTLYANSDIADVMDTADKYFYGEWGIVDSTTTPPTWGALGNVPIMTANNAPYGEASAYQVFDGNASTSASGTDFSYQSVNPICVKKFECSVNGGTLQGSNDGSTYTNISDPSSNTTYYMYHKVHFASSQTVHTLQFYGRELSLKNVIEPMTGNTSSQGTASASSTMSPYYPFKAFDGNKDQVADSSFWHTEENKVPAWLRFEFNNATSIRGVAIYPRYPGGSSQYGGVRDFVFQGSNTGNDNDWTPIVSGTVPPTTSTPKHYIAVFDEVTYKYYQLYISTSYSPYYAFVTELELLNTDYSEKEFASGSTAKWIYDHGVELETLTISGTGTKGSNAVTLSASGATATASITFTSGTWNTLNGKTGLNASGSPRIICGSGYAAITDRASLDVSAITGANNTGASQTASGTVDIDELWLE